MTRSFLAAFKQVHMGIGSVCHDGRQGTRHARADVGMKVKHCHDGHLGSDGGAHTFEELRVRTVPLRGEGGPMGADVHGIQRPGLLQALGHVVQKVLEESLVHRPTGLRSGHAQRHGLPVRGQPVHLGHEAGQVGQQAGRRLAQLLRQRISGQVGPFRKVGCGTHWSPAVAFDEEAGQGDSRASPVLGRRNHVLLGLDALRDGTVGVALGAIKGQCSRG